MLIGLLITLCLLMPLIGSVVSLIPYFNPRIKKYSVLLSILISVFLGCMAFYFQPRADYDLVRHQEIARYFISNGHTPSSLANSLGTNELEVLPQLFIFGISAIGDVDLIQFVIVTAGYAVMLYILRDYRNRTGLPNKYFIPLTIFTICGFYVLYFISGLFFYIAVILFALTAYLDYVKKSKRFVVYALYFLTLFIHDSMVFPVLITMLYKMLGNKLSLRAILVPSIGILLVSIVLGPIADWLNISFLQNIAKTYSTYISRNDDMTILYTGMIFFIEVTKLAFAIWMVALAWRRSRNNSLNGLLIVLAICTVLTMPNSIVMIRFVMPIQILGLIPTMDYFSSHQKKGVALPYIVMVVLALGYAGYFAHTIATQNFGDFWSERMIANPVDLYQKEDS